MAGLILRRGLEASRSGITPKEGEMIYITDTKKMWIGDGATAGGEGLNASTLDGVGVSQFVRNDANTTTSGVVLTVQNDDGIDITTSNNAINGLQVYQAIGSADALMTFHIGGDYAVHFGLDGGTNDLVVGGWSMGANAYKIWHSGNHGSGSGLNADLLDGQDGTYYAPIASPSFSGTPTAPTASNGTNTTQLATTSYVLANAVANPTGTVIAFSTSSIPAGYIKCNGANVSRTTYSSLFAVLGTLYGSGNGSTTFKLPDLRGEFIRGWADNRSVDTGRGIGTYQAEAYKSHRHTKESQGPQYSGAFTGVVGYYPGTSGSNTGYSGGTETRPRNRALMYVIKY